jgi:hypothetical protein
MVRRASTVVVFVGVLVFVAGVSAGDSTAQFRSATGPTKLACPAGATLDPVFATCSTCPRGYTMTGGLLGVLPCEKPGMISEKPATIFKPGTGPLGMDCPRGQKWDPTKGCYACPPGHERNLMPVDHPKACTGVTLPEFVAARTTSACPARAFRDIGRGNCWSCNGWHRTASPVDSPTACTSDVTGILGINASSVCSDALTAIGKGAAASAVLQTTLEALISPVMTPIREGVREIAGQIQTPAGLNNLVKRAGASFRPHRALIDDVVRMSDQVSKVRDRIGRLMLDPAIMCSGDLTRLNREVTALGLRPPQRAEADLAGGVAYSLVPRPRLLDNSGRSLARAPHFFSAFAVEGTILLPSRFSIVTSFTVVTDYIEHIGLFWSIGPALGAKEEAIGVEGTFTTLFFPYVEFADFDEIGALGVQVDIGAGDGAKAILSLLREVAWFPMTPPPNKLFALIPDGFSWSFDPLKIGAPRLPWGIGLNWPLGRTIDPTEAAKRRVVSLKGSGDWTIPLFVR